MVDVFISYSRQDLEQVSQLAQAIQAAGYDVWWDAELPPHKSYGEVITDKIENANAAIVVWSPTARESEWVRAEADMARSQKKLIQTALGDIMPPLPFNQIQFADLGDWNGEDDHTGWKKVKESLRDLCGEREASGDEGDGAATTAASAPAATAPTPPPEPAPAPTPAPASEPEPAEANTGPPPGSIEYHKGSAPAIPIIAGLGAGAVALLGGGALLVGALDDGDDYSSSDVEPFALSEPVEAPSTTELGSGSGSEPAPLPTIEPAPAPPPVSASGPTFTTAAQEFSGAIRQGQERTYGVGLNANTSYMITASCDVDCSDIDMWLYDENGNLIDEDVLEDDYPVLEVTPIRSAEFTVRLLMYACSIEPCGFEINVQPL